MKKPQIITLFVLILCSSCLNHLEENITQGHDGVNIELFLDKEVYYSNELMSISIIVRSDMEITNATLYLKGIFSGYYRLEQQFNLNLDKEGESRINTSFGTPPCNRCSGIQEGAYNITAEVFDQGNKIASSTINVEIKQ